MPPSALRRVLGAPFAVGTAVGTAVLRTTTGAVNVALQVAVAVIDISADATVEVLTSVSPRRVVEVVADVSRELAGGTPRRRCWSRDGRHWIEVRGLDASTPGQRLGQDVFRTLRALPGVESVAVNYALSRVVVHVTPGGVIRADLCEAITAAELRHEVEAKPATELPGDGRRLAVSLTGATLNAAGLGLALAGQTLGWPAMPVALSAAITVVDYQPRLRRVVETSLGNDAADLLLATAAAVGHTLIQSPASLVVDVMVQWTKALETVAAQSIWHDLEPGLAVRAGAPPTACPPRPVPRPPGPVERYCDASALAQIGGAALVGALTGNVTGAATAAMVAAPKAARTCRESFASALGRGLARDHRVLVLHPEALRRLDRVDALVVDPRTLTGPGLRVSRIRGVTEQHRARVWEWAQARLDRGELSAGWHPVTERNGDGRRAGAEVLISPVHHPLAPAVLAEARAADAEVMTVDTEDLDELRPLFDEVHPDRGLDLDEALAAVVHALQADGRTVAVLSTGAPQSMIAADVAIGLVAPAGPLPWQAHLLAEGLDAVWQLVHALPAARRASTRGIEIAVGASLLGTLFMIPGVRARGPGPVTLGAGAAVWTGVRAAHATLRDAAPMVAPSHDWHAMGVERVGDLLAAHRQDTVDRVGDDTPAQPNGMRFAVMEFAEAVREELSDPLTPVLAVGSAASAVLGSPVDAALVGSVLTGNAMLAAAQRVRAERLLRRLLTTQDPPARLRDAVGGLIDGVPANALRLGDHIEVRAGEVVPADARLVFVDGVEVDESALTGESLPVPKQVEAVPGAPLAERACMIHAGTTVVAGTAVALVTAVGPNTQAGRATAARPGRSADVGLQSQLRELTDRAWPASLAGGAVVGALGLLRGTGLRQAVSSAVAVSVAAVPEGLPLVATLAQQASARRLGHLGALVRSPRSIEALGRVDVVCFDKTGTLSLNELRVVDVETTPGSSREDVLACAGLATPCGRDSSHVHATDAAVAEAAGPQPVDEETAVVPFRSGRPFSATLVGNRIHLKGAPEVVLAACRDVDAGAEGAVEAMAARGLRVLAVADRDLTPDQATRARADDDALIGLCGQGLRLRGLLGLSDTVRPESPAVVAALVAQGVGVRIITGDHPITASAIAADLGLPVAADAVVTGVEWETLSRRGQERAVTDGVVFARMSPEHKVQIVETLQRVGRTCAMVGDGANDAAAIRAATVGVGVASVGSDPARTAADLVLLDGNIAVLLDALDEGHQLWRRVQAAVSVLLGGNAGEVLFAIVGTAVTGRAPLNTRQLLLVNLFTDGLPAAALAVSPPTDRMRSQGRGPDQAALWRTVAIRGTTTAAAATTAWAMASVTGRPRRASTVALVALVATQLGQTLLDSRSPLVIGTAVGSLATLATLISVPGVSQLLGSTPLGPVGWAQALGTAGTATVVSAVIPLLTGQRTAGADAAEDAEDSASAPSTATSPARHNTAYTSRNGTVSTRVTNSVNGSDPTMDDTADIVGAPDVPLRTST